MKVLLNSGSTERTQKKTIFDTKNIIHDFNRTHQTDKMNKEKRKSKLRMRSKVI